MEKRYPMLNVAGTYSPPVGFERDPYLAQECLRRVRDAEPDICFVALGAPKQEFWMRQYSKASGVPVMLGVGAGLDFVSGRSKRAPLFMQKIGLEWAWRLGQEPRRLSRRYLVDDSFFFVLLWREFWKRRQNQPS